MCGWLLLTLLLPAYQVYYLYHNNSNKCYCIVTVTGSVGPQTVSVLTWAPIILQDPSFSGLHPGPHWSLQCCPRPLAWLGQRTPPLLSALWVSRSSSLQSWQPSVAVGSVFARVLIIWMISSIYPSLLCFIQSSHLAEVLIFSGTAELLTPSHNKTATFRHVWKV